MVSMGCIPSLRPLMVRYLKTIFNKKKELKNNTKGRYKISKFKGEYKKIALDVAPPNIHIRISRN